MTTRSDDQNDAERGGPSERQLADRWRADMWSRYLNGEMLDMAYFDYDTYLKMVYARGRER